MTLVLLDVMMPGIDGYDLLRYLLPTGTPSIFITAKATTADKVKGAAQRGRRLHRQAVRPGRACRPG